MHHIGAVVGWWCGNGDRVEGRGDAPHWCIGGVVVWLCGCESGDGGLD